MIQWDSFRWPEIAILAVSAAIFEQKRRLYVLAFVSLYNTEDLIWCTSLYSWSSQKSVNLFSYLYESCTTNVWMQICILIVSSVSVPSFSKTCSEIQIMEDKMSRFSLFYYSFLLYLLSLMNCYITFSHNWPVAKYFWHFLW